MSAQRVDLAETIAVALRDSDMGGYTDINNLDDALLDSHYDLLAVADAVLADYQRKPRTVTTEAELDQYGWLTVIREEPRDEFGVEPPAIWEFAFQTGWARAGQMFNPEDQTPVLPVTVIFTPEATA